MAPKPGSHGLETEAKETKFMMSPGLHVNRQLIKSSITNLDDFH